MTEPTRVERARAEIERQRGYWVVTRLWGGMLDAATATLDRHLPESWDGPDFCCVCSSIPCVMEVWPCPDVAAVLDLFAPDTPTPPSGV